MCIFCHFECVCWPSVLVVVVDVCVFVCVQECVCAD